MFEPSGHIQFLLSTPPWTALSKQGFIAQMPGDWINYWQKPWGLALDLCDIPWNRKNAIDQKVHKCTRAGRRFIFKCQWQRKLCEQKPKGVQM